ncbi:hypothetical protein B296_00011590 [Ensete ventricosum]|uniref:Uncharacterized protein n=1 Tax=Ensete ventricosum TaxID=4639 RepID=A0A426ZCI3_ENSVE|nr:hypothetical protein B296_00011590 [Ensete ventricosum]
MPTALPHHRRPLVLYRQHLVCPSLAPTLTASTSPDYYYCFLNLPPTFLPSSIAFSPCSRSCRCCCHSFANATITAKLPPTFPPSATISLCSHSYNNHCCCLPLPDTTITPAASDHFIYYSARCHLPPLLLVVALDCPHLPSAAMLLTTTKISTAPCIASVPFPYCYHLLRLR